MDKKNISVWFITPKTNLHVGNENTSSYGLIDLAIQRNATTGLPCINSSSLKGALNEFAIAKELSGEERVQIFGSDKSGNTKSQKGNYIFFDANILMLPKQDSNGDKPYKLVTCDFVLNRFVQQVRQITGVAISNQQILNDYQCEKIDNEEFFALCSDDELPIIARNRLENGVSANLWYEQVLPAETVLYTFLAGDGGGKLENILSQDLVQIGANATIGYGYCEFKKL